MYCFNFDLLTAAENPLTLLLTSTTEDDMMETIQWW